MIANIEFLRELLQAPIKDVRSMLYTYFKQFKAEIDINDLSIVVNPKRAENNVILVAHYDTVFNDKTKRINYYDKEANVMFSPDGLGADDRAGVFGLCYIYEYCLKHNIKPPVLVFTDMEETGGYGAEEVASLYDFRQALFLIELDRRGSKDVVFYNDEPRRFVKHIEKFGFKESFGSFSDIQILGERWNLCSANLSVGYYNNHTKAEILKVNELFSTIEKTIKIIQKANTQFKLPKRTRKAPEKLSLLDDYYKKWWDDINIDPYKIW